MSTVSQDQFRVMFAESRAAFRLEYQRDPLPGEQEALQYWLSGNLMVPWEWPDWRNWLDLTWRHTSHGGEILRVRLIDEPPTPYQRFATHCTTWHEQAGDRIRYLRRPAAEQLGIVTSNWWMFDDTNVVLLNYDGGEVPSKILVTDPAEIRRYQSWRDLALSHATAAEAVTT
jgi:uncharacterized protein DUF6879